MRNFLTEIPAQTQNFSVCNFEEKFADDVLQIQSETDLSFWSKNAYLSELGRADSIFKIAHDVEGKIIGFALVRLLSGGKNSLFESAEIINIAVRESFQNTGIGQMIFDEILRELKEKNIKEIWLEVRASNSKAIAFYQKNDFEKQFERKNYYQNPTENALIFQVSVI